MVEADQRLGFDAMSHDEETHTSRRLTVTIDARALDGVRMGTQVHVLELVRALAQTERLLLRALVRGEEIDRETLALLRELPGHRDPRRPGGYGGHPEERRVSPPTTDLLP